MSPHVLAALLLFLLGGSLVAVVLAVEIGDYIHDRNAARLRGHDRSPQ